LRRWSAATLLPPSGESFYGDEVEQGLRDAMARFEAKQSPSAAAFGRRAR
jgi:hypothetical protein